MTNDFVPYTFSTPLRQSDQFRPLWVQVIILYLLSWIIVYLNLPVPVRVTAVLIFLGLSLRSFQTASAIFLLALFMPYFTEFLGFKISGLNSVRLLAIPYLYLAFRHPPIRTLKFNQVFLLLLFVAMLTILSSAEIRKLVQETPVSEMNQAPGLLNLIARTVDIIVMFLFIYLTLSRFKIPEIENLFNLLLLCGLLEAITIIFLVIQSPESIIGEQFDKYYLWRNPYFGHKNDWAMMLVFMVLAAYIKRKISESNKTFYLLVMVFASIAIVFSLSRQSYVSLILGFMLISFLQGNIKPALYLTIALILLLSIQPKFLFDRIDTFVSVSSIEDFQGLSRKVGDLAINQFKSNLTIIPRMFFTDYEYNWSEGFYNGLAHQQGIIGLVFHTLFYIYFMYRYFIISKSNILILSYVGSIMCIFMVIILISNFNRRGINYMHYDGKIEQFGFMLLYFTFMAEFTLYYYKDLLSKSEEEVSSNS